MLVIKMVMIAGVVGFFKLLDHGMNTKECVETYYGAKEA